MVHDPNLSVVPNSYKIQKTVESASLERNKVVVNEMREPSFKS